MQDELKKVIACGVVGSVTLMTVVPPIECERHQLCEVKSPELPHIEQQRTDTGSGYSARTLIVATSTSNFTGSMGISGGPLVI